VPWWYPSRAASWQSHSCRDKTERKSTAPGQVWLSTWNVATERRPLCAGSFLQPRGIAEDVRHHRPRLSLVSSTMTWSQVLAGVLQSPSRLVSRMPVPKINGTNLYKSRKGI